VIENDVVGIQSKISRLQVYLLVEKLTKTDKTMNLFNRSPPGILSLLRICIFPLPSITLTHNAFVWHEVIRATTDQRHL